uniref:Methyltransferase domain-containing protein n=1 Tax=Ignavibacterium album TaxID=591197 RepID=A0A832G6K4_9BACT
MVNMKPEQSIFLPGGFKQFRLLKSKVQLNEKVVLIIGPQSEKIGEKIIDAGAKSVDIIVSDYDSLISSRLNIPKEKNISVRMMDYDNTDFADDTFDLVYAQASISLKNRNKIIKEIKRILKPEALLCVGEITALRETYPQFVKDIFESSGILPLHHNKCAEYYESKNFSLDYEEDLSSSLRSYYENTVNQLKSVIETLSDKEKSYYKKLLNRISHESNAYLKLGADKYIGFKLLILKLRAVGS